MKTEQIRIRVDLKTKKQIKKKAGHLGMSKYLIDLHKKNSLTKK